MHFITSRVDGALNARDVLGSLSRQLMATHQLGGDLPAVEADLRHLFADLLCFKPANEAQIVVVIDGLDEAIGSWKPEGLWPVSMSDSARVILSARSIADTDWVTRLALAADRTEVLDLDRLNQEEIGQLVESVLGGDSAVAERVATVTKGDPFYVHDVVEDLIRDGTAAFDRLADHHVDHLQYLLEWWIEARERNPGRGFVDLMGTLAVARAPLSAATLVRISPDDALTGADLPGLMKDAGRYLEGTDTEGYRLASSCASRNLPRR